MSPSPCCAKPNVQIMDYARGSEVVTNRHCLSCGSHEHDGQRYTRAEWDAHVSGKCSDCGMRPSFDGMWHKPNCPSLDGPGEEDGPWAEGWEERSGQSF